jgi:hypothetical protein
MDQPQVSGSRKRTISQTEPIMDHSSQKRPLETILERVANDLDDATHVRLEESVTGKVREAGEITIRFQEFSMNHRCPLVRLSSVNTALHCLRLKKKNAVRSSRVRRCAPTDCFHGRNSTFDQLGQAGSSIMTTCRCTAD